MIEKSAGGIIVFHSKTCWWVLVMKDRSGSWTFPKGKIESGESARDAAIREIQEEVGIRDLAYRATCTPSKYYYFRNVSIKKTVQYYLFESFKKSKPVVQKEEGISEAKWVLLSTAKKMIGYPKTNVLILEEVYDYTHSR